MNLILIKKAMDALSEAIQKVGAAMYQGQNTEDSTQNTAGEKTSENQKPDENAAAGSVDAEYKEVPK